MNSDHYSPDAIDRRLRHVSQLLRLCIELRRAGTAQESRSVSGQDNRRWPATPETAPQHSSEA